MPDSASTTLIASVGEALMMAIQFKDEKQTSWKRPSGPTALSKRHDELSGGDAKEFELWQYLERPNSRTLIERSSLPDAMVLKVLRDWIEVGAIKFQLRATENSFFGSAFERRLALGSSLQRFGVRMHLRDAMN